MAREDIAERIRQEVALYGLRADVDEELAASHPRDRSAPCPGAGGAVGRRLDFLMQELNREANTLGSKAAAIELTNAAVELKMRSSRCANRSRTWSEPMTAQPFAGNMFLVVAPSGAGKSTLVNALLAEDEHIDLSVSYTTRPPRPGEQDGREYHFVEVDDSRRGARVASSWKARRFTATTTDLARLDQEADARRHGRAAGDRLAGRAPGEDAFPSAVGIFILPPSIDALRSAPAQARAGLAAGDRPPAAGCRRGRSPTPRSSNM